MSTLQPLTRDAILTIEDRKIVPVSVPEWGGIVHVRVMSGGERDEWEFAQAANAKADVRARWVAYTACDEQGLPLFRTEDIEALSTKNSVALQRIFKAAMAINKVTAADVEELEKNSEAGR